MPEVLRGVLSVEILVKKPVVTRAQERVWMERAIEVDDKWEDETPRDLVEGRVGQ